MSTCIIVNVAAAKGKCTPEGWKFFLRFNVAGSGPTGDLDFRVFPRASEPVRDVALPHVISLTEFDHSKQWAQGMGYGTL